ncbi:hypothetical protein LX32DRAFT_157200 [Colletotrichum zoysiae]|uniref:Uncharacterized protein n=1 Tax=Colletotrichum zoysiae TaxID=1216348 RepID=A0AAD9HPT1_9PEZI|nr:hypothetical protein LX32DRAFT_157200 [Colletotrichum zoysiae]
MECGRAHNEVLLPMYLFFFPGSSLLLAPHPHTHAPPHTTLTQSRFHAILSPPPNFFLVPSPSKSFPPPQTPKLVQVDNFSPETLSTTTVSSVFSHSEDNSHLLCNTRRSQEHLYLVSSTDRCEGRQNLPPPPLCALHPPSPSDISLLPSRNPRTLPLRNNRKKKFPPNHLFGPNRLSDRSDSLYLGIFSSSPASSY